jgi:hypothetical protein
VDHSHPGSGETLAERRIQEAIQAGEFDGLPGEGRPLAGAGTPDDELWWVRGWLKRNGVDPAQPARVAEEDL